MSVTWHSVFCPKKRITERNSHLTGEANSTTSGCQAKTDRRSELAELMIRDGETQKCVTARENSNQTFLMTGTRGGEELMCQPPPPEISSNITVFNRV